MSGGHFDVYTGNLVDELQGEWQDEEINDLFEDLFGRGWNGKRSVFGHRSPYVEHDKVEFGPRGGGLFESLDFWLSGDTSEEDYRDDVRRFKEKWFRKTPKNRVEYYQRKFTEYATEMLDKFREELQ